MIIAYIKGGLGNQMFQYSTGYALAKKYKTYYKLDLSHFDETYENETRRYFELNLFNVDHETATEKDIERVSGNIVSKLLKGFNSILLSFSIIDYPIQKYLGFKEQYLDGYFQSEKFFKEYREDILKQFTLRKDLETKEYKEVANKISADKNTISMHIRRGDYVTDIKTTKHHGILDIEYYKQALKMLNAQKSYIYIFSDDIDWVKKNFTFLPKNTYFVSKHKFTSAQEITLMSLCHHNIIANSSFSWWGAWLNRNEDKVVIAPKKWTKSLLCKNTDVTPKDWYRI